MNNKQPQILLVDPTQLTRETIEPLLREENWNHVYAATHAEALELLQTHPVDLLLATDNTPDANSLGIIETVRKRYPAVVRLYVAEGKDSIDTITALAQGLVQQIIPNPWIDQELKEIIRSALRQSSLQKKYGAEFQATINSVPLLPALPESYSNVRSCIVGEEVNIEKMAAYISQDVSIATALLHWANSALFGQRFRVDTIKKAIIVLGTDIVESLILAEAVNRTLAGELPNVKGFDFAKFKKHSMATAVLSRLLIKSLTPSDFIQHDRAFIAGLLHDMGKLAAASFFPRQLEKAIETSKMNSCDLFEAELECYGTQHAELGSFLAEWWALPPFVVNAIFWHHHPQATPVDQEIIIATHIANLLSYQFGYGSNGDTCPREIHEQYLQQFYITEETTEILKNETEKTIKALVR